METKIKKAWYKKWWVWVICLFLIVMVFGNMDTEKKTEEPKSDNVVKKEESNKTTTNDVNKSEVKKEKEPAKEPIKEAKTRDNSTAKETDLGTGDFIVGQDIPAGRYVIKAISGTGNFFVYDKNGIPVINEIFSNDKTMGVETISTDLKEGQKIQISGIPKVKFTPAETSMQTNLTTGRWVVGLDIKAGRYICKTTGGTGNFFVYRSGIPVVNEILGTDPDMGVPNVTATLKDGDEISIQGLRQVNFTVK